MSNTTALNKVSALHGLLAQIMDDSGPQSLSSALAKQASELLSEVGAEIADVTMILAGSDYGSLPNDYPLTRLASDRMAPSQPDGRVAKLEGALRKLRSYNADIEAGRINYRPLDHIAVIDAALGGTK